MQPNEIPQSRNEVIQREFEKLGGRVSTRLFAEHLLATGIYDDEWLETATIKAIQNDVRRALKASDAAGLPFACAVGRGANAVFTQRTLMDYDAYAAVIGDLCSGIEADHAVIVGLRDECRDRYGHAPDIPDLVWPGEWNESAA